MVDHPFGGAWTERKLQALRNYLVQYQKIFSHNPRAKTLKTVYVDAFAGTGRRDIDEDPTQPSLFGYEDEMAGYQEGSVRIALSLPEKFHRYVFLDNKQAHVRELRSLVSRDFSDLAERCLIERADANEWLQKWCQQQNWKTLRAVVFLDPYGMSVEWKTLEEIAQTQAIDLWVLFPLGIGASRVLPTAMPPEGAWAQRLTKLFGSEEWRARFYQPRRSSSLLDDGGGWTKVVGVDEILQYFLERLRASFAGVVEHPLILKNSRNSPMYALCFAAGNPRGAKPAVKIASYLTRVQ